MGKGEISKKRAGFKTVQDHELPGFPRVPTIRSRPSVTLSPAVLLRGQAPQRPGREGIRVLREKVDTVIIIPNDRLLQVVEKKTCHHRRLQGRRRRARRACRASRT